MARTPSSASKRASTGRRTAGNTPKKASSQCTGGFKSPQTLKVNGPSLLRRSWIEWCHVAELPKSIAVQAQSKPKLKTGQSPAASSTDSGDNAVGEMIDTCLRGLQCIWRSRTSIAATLFSQTSNFGTTALIRIQQGRKIPTPKWHAPWKLMRVISGHTGWVRCLAVDSSNEWFVTGAGDRMIKIWDLASGTLKLSLTGHISAVRVTGGRDATARVWDIRTKDQIFALTGHASTVSDIKCQEADPQIITASSDSTIRLWDLVAGRTMSTLTHHKKSVRALTINPLEFTFASGSTDYIKQWRCPQGNFIQNLEGHNSIVNTLSCNQDNVMFSGADNGSMYFWDWKSGYNFQIAQSPVQPGSLDSEAGIFCSIFDRSGSRLITGEADKTIKIWKEDEQATPETHPIRDWKPRLNMGR
ncbi:hypothetical protein BASA81_009320 [Batrachochytrium salamandrivorans]|nr:hypothetical protein BASA81_009320 [Batrachochytrium salamandrivorans]